MTAKKKPAAKVAKKAAGMKTAKMTAKVTPEPEQESYTFRTSRWESDEGPHKNTIDIEWRVDADCMPELLKELAILQAQHDELLKRHAFLLRDSANQARIIAVYRDQAAREAEASTSGGRVELAT